MRGQQVAGEVLRALEGGAAARAGVRPRARLVHLAAVARQPARVGERLAALRARVRRRGVQPRVRRQRARRRERHVAADARARVRLRVGVQPRVAPQRRGVAEGGAAPRARVRLLAGVHAHVRLHLRALQERLAAGVARERLHAAVDRDVLVQVRDLVERLPADLARERPLPGVDPRVHLQVAPLLEALPAGVARVALHLRVGLHVLVQVALPAECLRAARARVRLALRVRPRVQLVGRQPVEPLPAGVAREPLLSGVGYHVRFQVSRVLKLFVALFAVDLQRLAVCVLIAHIGLFLDITRCTCFYFHEYVRFYRFLFLNRYMFFLHCYKRSVAHPIIVVFLAGAGGPRALVICLSNVNYCEVVCNGQRKVLWYPQVLCSDSILYCL